MTSSSEVNVMCIAGGEPREGVTVLLGFDEIAWAISARHLTWRHNYYIAMRVPPPPTHHTVAIWTDHSALYNYSLLYFYTAPLNSCVVTRKKQRGEGGSSPSSQRRAPLPPPLVVNCRHSRRFTESVTNHVNDDKNIDYYRTGSVTVKIEICFVARNSSRRH